MFIRISIWDDGSLEIINVTVLDEGSYTCFAENDRGKANNTGVLSVTGNTFYYVYFYYCHDIIYLLFLPLLLLLLLLSSIAPSFFLITPVFCQNTF